jgi:acyl-CoA thioesterase
MSDAQKLAERVVSGMMARDAFSQWLGIEVLVTKPDESVVRMTVRPEMVNGFGVAHGGISYSLADSALAFAANTNGNITVAIDNGITYPAAIHVGDVLTATCTRDSTTRRLGFYSVVVTNQKGVTVATFKGTVYRTDKVHEPTNPPTHQPTK